VTFWKELIAICMFKIFGVSRRFLMKLLFLRRVVTEENTASIFRLTKLVQVDTEVIRRKNCVSHIEPLEKCPLKSERPLVRHVPIPLPAFRSYDRPYFLRPSYINKTFLLPRPFSVHFSPLSPCTYEKPFLKTTWCRKTKKHHMYVYVCEIDLILCET